MANKDFTDPARMEKIVSLCKRRGFIFQAGELYGGLNGCWDYGPLGAELKRNLKDYWWRKTVQERDDVLGMDGAILTMEQVLVSSGHVGGFSDPMCDCLLSKARLRADQIPAQDGTAVYFSGAKHEATGWSSDKPFAVLVAPGKDPIESHKTARKFYADHMPDKKISPKELELTEDRREEVTGSTSFNPENGGLLTEPLAFQDVWFWVGAAAFMTGYVSYFAMLFCAASAQLTFNTDNRATPLRVVMLTPKPRLSESISGMLGRWSATLASGAAKAP